MLGPGTGVAPFRAFLQARAAEAAASAPPRAAWWLFFGCRRESKDFLFGAELRALLAPPPSRLVTAFSRDTPGEKVYVTHRLAAHGAEVWQLLDAGAHVYVAGSSGQMPKDVRAALVEIVASHGAMAPDAAEAYVGKMEVLKRYIAETW
jgi:sulfite reductase alpha subunit-like flavoprotein